MIRSPTVDVHLFVYYLMRAMASSHHHTHSLRTGAWQTSGPSYMLSEKENSKRKEKEAEIKGTKVQEGRDFGRDRGA